MMNHKEAREEIVSAVKRNLALIEELRRSSSKEHEVVEYEESEADQERKAYQQMWATTPSNTPAWALLRRCGCVIPKQDNLCPSCGYTGCNRCSALLCAYCNRPVQSYSSGP